MSNNTTNTTNTANTANTASANGAFTSIKTLIKRYKASPKVKPTRIKPKKKVMQQPIQRVIVEKKT